MLNTNNIIIDEFCDVFKEDYPDFCDAHPIEARFMDTKKYLTEEELIELEEKYSSFVHEQLLLHIIANESCIDDEDPTSKGDYL